MSLTLAAVVMTFSRVPRPSQIKWFLHARFPPVDRCRAPLLRADVGAIHARTGPVKLAGRVQLRHQDPVQLIEDSCLLAAVQTPPARLTRAEPKLQRQALPRNVGAEDKQNALKTESVRLRPRRSTKSASWFNSSSMPPKASETNSTAEDGFPPPAKNSPPNISHCVYAAGSLPSLPRSRRRSAVHAITGKMVKLGCRYELHHGPHPHKGLLWWQRNRMRQLPHNATNIATVRFAASMTFLVSDSITSLTQPSPASRNTLSMRLLGAACACSDQLVKR